MAALNNLVNEKAGVSAEMAVRFEKMGWGTAEGWLKTLRGELELDKIDILSILSIMKFVTATDAKQRLAAVLDAAQREPVTIKRQNREVAVVISPEDYRRLTGANIEAFQRFCDQVSRQAVKAGLTEKKLEQLLEI